MNAAYEKLIQHLDELNFKYVTGADSSSVCFDLQGEVGTYRFIAVVDEDGDLFQIFACSPVRIPEGARFLVSEAITRANYGLRLGKFEMDFEDGEVRFQISQMLAEGVLHDEIIGRSFAAATAILDQYLPAVLSVVYGNEPPREAIRRVEAAPRGCEDAASDAEDER